MDTWPLDTSIVFPVLSSLLMSLCMVRAVLDKPRQAPTWLRVNALMGGRPVHMINKLVGGVDLM